MLQDPRAGSGTSFGARDEVGLPPPGILIYDDDEDEDDPVEEDITSSRLQEVQLFAARQCC